MRPLLPRLKLWFTAALFAPVLMDISCSNTPAGNKAVQQTAKPAQSAAHQKPSSSFLDTIVIKASTAVFYSPDSLQLEKIKAVTGSAVFESLEHENFFQVRNSKIVLKKYYPQVKVSELKNVRYLVFKKDNGDSKCIDLDKFNDASGLLVFDGRQDPRLLDMTNIDTELGFYFVK